MAQIREMFSGDTYERTHKCQALCFSDSADALSSADAPSGGYSRTMENKVATSSPQWLQEW